MYPLTRKPAPGNREGRVALDVLRAAQRAGELVHLQHIPGRDGQTTSWPPSVRPEIAAAFAARDIAAPWTPQAAAATLAGDGQHVILATSAASGKSAGYLDAALSQVLDGGTALYLAPTTAPAAARSRAMREPASPRPRTAMTSVTSRSPSARGCQAAAGAVLPAGFRVREVFADQLPLPFQ